MGVQTGEVGWYVSQSDDQNNSGAITGWNSSSKPGGSWSDTSKTGNDLCPPGYRVPTSIQWQAVIDNNDIERVGSWAGDGNYTSALYFRNPSNIRALMFPTTSYRYLTDGWLISRGNSGDYWSSSEAGSLSNYLGFDRSNSNVYVRNSSRTFLYSVRCVAE
ncbi:TPA: FISUMP domain-containing protein [Elizabethkingia anophelis]